jgi:hypothetical protein
MARSTRTLSRRGRGTRDRRRGGKATRRRASSSPPGVRPATATKSAGGSATALAELTPDPEVGIALTEEERIESAKYLPRHLPKRLFEEERFLFPESYGVNRVRLLVKDPEWLFAYWDVDPRSVDLLRNEIGERALALTRLTLRIADARGRDASVILLPYGARAWYVRAETTPRHYRAHLGWTLPSGEFRPLAESNTVTTPRSGPSSVSAARRVRFGATPEAIAAAAPPPAEERPRSEKGRTRAASRKRPKGGASDVYRR